MSTTCTGERSAHPHLRCLACHRQNPAPPAALHTFPIKQQRSAPTHATQVWATVHSTAASLRRAAIAWDLLYLGRNRHGPDGPTVCDAPAAGRGDGAARVVRAGFSTCAHAYALTRRGAERLLALGMEAAVGHPVHLPAVLPTSLPKSLPTSLSTSLSASLSTSP